MTTKASSWSSLRKATEMVHNLNYKHSPRMINQSASRLAMRKQYLKIAPHCAQVLSNWHQLHPNLNSIKRTSLSIALCYRVKSSDFQSTTRRNCRSKRNKLWVAVKEAYQTISIDFSKSTLRWWTRWLWKTLASNKGSFSVWSSSKYESKTKKRVLSMRKPAMVN